MNMQTQQSEHHTMVVCRNNLPNLHFGWNPMCTLVVFDTYPRWNTIHHHITKWRGLFFMGGKSLKILRFVTCHGSGERGKKLKKWVCGPPNYINWYHPPQKKDTIWNTGLHIAKPIWNFHKWILFRCGSVSHCASGKIPSPNSWLRISELTHYSLVTTLSQTRKRAFRSPYDVLMLLNSGRVLIKSYCQNKNERNIRTSKCWYSQKSWRLMQSMAKHGKAGNSKIQEEKNTTQPVFLWWQWQCKKVSTANNQTESI